METIDTNGNIVSDYSHHIGDGAVSPQSCARTEVSNRALPNDFDAILPEHGVDGDERQIFRL